MSLYLFEVQQEPGGLSSNTLVNVTAKVEISAANQTIAPKGLSKRTDRAERGYAGAGRFPDVLHRAQPAVQLLRPRAASRSANRAPTRRTSRRGSTSPRFARRRRIRSGDHPRARAVQVAELGDRPERHDVATGQFPRSSAPAPCRSSTTCRSGGVELGSPNAYDNNIRNLTQCKPLWSDPPGGCVRPATCRRPQAALPPSSLPPSPFPVLRVPRRLHACFIIAQRAAHRRRRPATGRR